MTHIYNHKKDKFDSRDYKFSQFDKLTQLPPSVDLRPQCSPVRDQGNLGCCSGFALTAMREFMEIKNKSLLARVFKPTILSPLFVYYEERVIEGTVNSDSGAMLRDGMKVLASLGACPEKDDPYVIHEFNLKPSAKTLQDAIKYEISQYQKLSTLQDVKTCLASGNGFVLGFEVYNSFENGEVESTGVMPVPIPGEPLLGGHAVFCCGYCDDSYYYGGGYLIIKNSWGKAWGPLGGYFYMPYNAFSSVTDMWTAIK